MIQLKLSLWWLHQKQHGKSITLCSFFPTTWCHYHELVVVDFPRRGDWLLGEIFSITQQQHQQQQQHNLLSTHLLIFFQINKERTVVVVVSIIHKASDNVRETHHRLCTSCCNSCSLLYSPKERLKGSSSHAFFRTFWGQACSPWSSIWL